MASLDRNVELRDPVGNLAGGSTSDLLIDGAPYDVYIPTSANSNRIVSAMSLTVGFNASKRNQSGSVSTPVVTALRSGGSMAVIVTCDPSFLQ